VIVFFLTYFFHGDRFDDAIINFSYLIQALGKVVFFLCEFLFLFFHVFDGSFFFSNQ